MRTLIILLTLVVGIVLVVLWVFFKDDSWNLQNMFNIFKKDHKGNISADHLHKINTKYFTEWLELIEFHHPELNHLKKILHTHIIGMDSLINAIIINILCGGHVLVEWFPGLAKTKTIHTFSQLLGLDFKRIQFTPDLLPADILGWEIYNSKSQVFDTKMWPIMANIILADEINRATPKVQSALLEAMQEHQVTIWWITHKLPSPFFVLATQNPIEQEGTYPLPEAQIDRFLFKVLVKYPSLADEKKILDTMEKEDLTKIKSVVSHSELAAIKKDIDDITISDEIKHYITRLTSITRQEHEYILYGTSPRGSIGLMLASKAVALATGRKYVTHEDVQKVALPVLRHRIILNYQAKLAWLTEDQVLLELFETVSLV
jgi:MoxR-like ATPase